jgi:hypothetical protein
LTLTIEFHAGAKGALKPDVEFDKSKFAAYADSVTLGKISMLQETLVNEAPVGGVQPKTISRLLTDLTGKSYDFERMTLNGRHGGNILTATMPGAVDSLVGRPVSVFDSVPAADLLGFMATTLDGDHAWREDSQTRISELYRYHETGGRQPGSMAVHRRATGPATPCRPIGSPTTA